MVSTQTSVGGEKLETVYSLKYLGSVLSDEGSTPKKKKKPLQNCTNNSRDDKTEAYLEWRKHHVQLEDQTDAVTGNFNTWTLARRIETTEIIHGHWREGLKQLK